MKLKDTNEGKSYKVVKLPDNIRLRCAKEGLIRGKTVTVLLNKKIGANIMIGFEGKLLGLHPEEANEFEVSEIVVI